MLEHLDQFLVTHETKSAIGDSFSLQEVHENFLNRLKLPLEILKCVQVFFFIMIVA